MILSWRNLIGLIIVGIVVSSNVSGQSMSRDLALADGGTLEIMNKYGRIEVSAMAPPDESDKLTPARLTVNAKSRLTENEIKISSSAGSVVIEVDPSNRGDRVDLSLSVPARTRVRLQTAGGEIRVSGDLAIIEARTETGTIAVNIPTDDVRYEMLWTESRPRFLSDLQLEKVKEKSAGRFSIKGKFRREADEIRSENTVSKADPPGEVAAALDVNGKVKDGSPKTISLNFITARGIVLINVPPNEVMSDLRERPLTNAAKAMIRSGDTLLMDAIRRASPKYFGEYARTLPPLRREPEISTWSISGEKIAPTIRSATVRVTDLRNRAVSNLKAEDFEVAESGEAREVISVREATAPVNLVLLLDVSGSIENYITFIRKAARAFIRSVGPHDRMSIIIFNEDVKSLSGFTTDKAKLSASLDTFDAGGGTAYYDALGYTLTDALRPLRGERTAVVVLTDGDDNRSFLPLGSLMGTIEESGALIYPLYVPTSLIAAAVSDPSSTVDPLRSRYLSSGLTSRADEEGGRLAKASGGVYYPITQLSQIQTAYDDIVAQIRTAYEITFRSEYSTPAGKPSTRLKIRTKISNTFVQVYRVD